MKTCMYLVLLFFMCAFCSAQTAMWQEPWKEARLPEGWSYVTYNKAQTSDAFGFGKGRLLGKIVFNKGSNWKVVYYAYHTRDSSDERSLLTAYRNHAETWKCREQNMPGGKGEWTLNSQGYTNNLQIGHVLYVLDNCHITPCPYTGESWAFVRSLLEFMEQKR